MTSSPSVTLTDGSPVTPDHRELKPNGQQKGYVVLSEEERRKGFVRPYRDKYVHVGLPAPKYPLRDLIEEEKESGAKYGYVKYEEYSPAEAPLVGRFWTQPELDKVNKGCGVVTKMSHEIAETYARDPHFYGGTFCVGCRVHLPLNEFVWDGTNERVGS